jgi:hypothetical protein
MVKIRGYEITNDITELTIDQFEKVSKILNDEELDKFEKWADVFIFLGVPVSEVNDMEFDEFINYVKEFNATQGNNDLEMVQEFELEGYTYRAFEDEFKLKVRDLKMIEKAMGKDNSNYFARLMSILFKRTDLTNAEHYENAHLKHKEKLFKDLSATLVVPYVVAVSRKLITQNEATEVVE